MFVCVCRRWLSSGNFSAKYAHCRAVYNIFEGLIHICGHEHTSHHDHVCVDYSVSLLPQSVSLLKNYHSPGKSEKAVSLHDVIASAGVLHYIASFFKKGRHALASLKAPVMASDRVADIMVNTVLPLAASDLMHFVLKEVVGSITNTSTRKYITLL